MPKCVLMERTRGTRMLPAGSPVSYNGTDILTLDRCTGLIKEVQSSQDYVTLFHVLGIPMPSS